MLRRIAVAAALAALVTTTPAHATQSVAVGAITDRAGFLSVLYHRDLTTTYESTVELATKADCMFEAVGSDLIGGVEGVFVAHVVAMTTGSEDLNPIDRIPVATSITCELYDNLDRLIDYWTALRSANVAYLVEKHPLPWNTHKICARGTVYFGNGSSVDLPGICRSA